MLNEAVVKLLRENLWHAATCCTKHWPNVVPVGLKDVLPDGRLVIGDVFLDQTLKNVSTNEGKIAVSACDATTHEGYQIKGRAVYESEGELVETLRKVAAEKSGGKLKVRGALVITPRSCIVTTPGPDNKKMLDL